MTKGDAMRLISGCVAWNRKRKRENSVGTTDTPSTKRTTPATTPVVPTPLIVRYEMRYPEGGATTWFGDPMTSEGSTPDDRITFYYNDALKAMVPVPGGYSAPPRVEVEEGFF
jgi:hypothetical protein